MWAIKCNPDKMILFSSFLVVLVVCLMLLCEDGDDYTEWLMENVADLRQEEVEGFIKLARGLQLKGLLDCRDSLATIEEDKNGESKRH